jgi:hypothetical protein
VSSCCQCDQLWGWRNAECWQATAKCCFFVCSSDVLRQLQGRRLAGRQLYSEIFINPIPPPAAFMGTRASNGLLSAGCSSRVGAGGKFAAGEAAGQRQHRPFLPRRSAISMYGQRQRRHNIFAAAVAVRVGRRHYRLLGLLKQMICK